MPSLTDNTAKWGVRKLTKFQENSGIPVGFEYFSTNPNIPAGSIPLFGGEYSREVYSDLWSWVQEQAGYLLEESVWQEKSAANNGNVPFYSKGNGTTTFRVPSLKCWVKGANGIEEVGSYLSAGLPILPDMSHTHTRGTMNITGEITWITSETGNISNSGYPTTGAFRWGNEAYTSRASLASGEGSRDLNFDASRSWTGETSSASLTRTTDIYGNSDTVQPKSIVGMWLVKAYGTITNVGSTDVSNIAQGLTELETAIDTVTASIPTKVSALENDAGYLTKHQSLEYEKYVSYVINGATSQPASSIMQYTATGAFTLNLSSISSKLAAKEATVFTAYIKSNADYTLTITNAGTIKYVGNASDVAITSAGLLLNIMMLKDVSGNVTSIVQASKLS